MAILPTRSEGHVDVPLSNVLIARMAESVGNVNKTMFPAVNVPRCHDKDAAGNAAQHGTNRIGKGIHGRIGSWRRCLLGGNMEL